MAGGNSSSTSPAPKEQAPTQDASVASPPPARIATVQYDAGEGWELGQRAPEDRYVEVGPDGQAVGKPSKTPKKGAYARQVAVKGSVVDAGVRAALGLK